MNEVIYSHPIHDDFNNILSSVEDMIHDMIIWILWKIVKVMDLIIRAK